MISDGDTYWVFVEETGGWCWREYDPATGAAGRVSLPAFVEQGAVDGQPLLLGSCQLRPVPAQLEASPLGTVGGLVGWRGRHTPDGGYSGEGIDGRSFTVSGAMGIPGQLVGILRFPGSDQDFGVLGTNGYHDSHVRLCAADGFVTGHYHLGGDVPPLEFWHYLRVRDANGSSGLRALTDEQAATLLTGAGVAARAVAVAKAAETRARAAGQLSEAAVAALVTAAQAAARTAKAEVRTLARAVVPQLADDTLTSGVSRVVRAAARRAAQLNTLAVALAQAADLAAGGPDAVDELEPQETAARPPAAVRDGMPLHHAVAGLLPTRYGQGDNVLDFVKAVGAALTTPGPAPTRVTLPSLDEDWLHAVGSVRALLVRAAAPLIPAAQREALLILLENIAAADLCQPDARLRLVRLVGPRTCAWKAGEVIQIADNRLLVRSGVDRDGECAALQYAPNGNFVPVPDFRFTSAEPIAPAGCTAAQITEFVAAVRAHGPYPLCPERATDLSEAGGMSQAEATLLLAGLPGDKAWEHPDIADTRAGLGVTAQAAGCARSTWNAVPWRVRSAMLATLLPAQGGTCWKTVPGPTGRRPNGCGGTASGPRCRTN